MKAYKLSSFIGSTLFALTAFGQPTSNINEKPLTISGAQLDIKDCFNPKYYPETVRMFQWIPGTEFYTQFEAGDLVLYNAKSKSKVKILLTKSDFATAVQELIAKNAGSFSNEINKNSLPAISWEYGNNNGQLVGYFQNNGKSDIQIIKIVMNSNDPKIQMGLVGTIPSSAQATEISKTEGASVFRGIDGKFRGNLISYVYNYNLYVQNHNDQSFNQVTFDGAPGITYGQTVHRSEFGINKGLFHGPMGGKLAFYRMDERRVTDYPLFSIAERPAKPSTIKYPMAGDSSHTVTVGIYDQMQRTTVYLKTDGPYDQYLTNITWSPDEKFVYIAWVNREQNEMQLRQYSSTTGELVKTLFTHKHAKYIEPENGPLFVPNSNTDFIWQSKIDGYNHLYLYKNGTLTQITSGKWEITDVYGFDASGNYILANSTRNADPKINAEDPVSRSPLAIEWNNLKSPVKLLFQGHPEFVGTHLLFANLEGGYVASFFSNVSNPRIVMTINLSETLLGISKKSASPLSFNVILTSKNPILGFQLGDVKLGTLENKGITFHTRTFYPPNFNPSKKYPVVFYVYGGPHAQMVTNSWLGGGQLWMHYMAQHGYIVFTMDNRGSAHRGLEFENATHRQLGTVEMEDQLFALNYLKQQPFVDTARVGVHGWSFGGFMTTSLMARHPGAFKVGVAGGPVIDWTFYEIMYTERYMDKPQENPEGYKANNLLNYAGNLKGRLFMIHGADDDVVVWQHSLMFVQKCVQAKNNNIDYFVYPGHKHNVIGTDRTHLYDKVCQYFFDHL